MLHASMKENLHIGIIEADFYNHPAETSFCLQGCTVRPDTFVDSGAI